MGFEYNVLIIGAGNIGAFFDTPISDIIITHAHAFVKTEGFKLIGFYDSDYEKAKRAAEIWGTNCFHSIEEAFNNKIDVVSLAVPDKYHYEFLLMLSQKQIKLVFAEKPLAKSIEQAKVIIDLYKKNGISICVNYSRRFVPEFIQISEKITKGEYGDFLTGTGYYGKGILHNGSHAIDILRYLIGEILDFKAMNFTFDYVNDDPSVSAILHFGEQQYFSLQYINSNYYTIFEIDLFFQKKRIRIFNSGTKIEEYDIVDSDKFYGYRYPVKMLEIDTSDEISIFYAAKNIYQHLTNGTKLLCTAEDGYAAMKVCLGLKDGLK